jgi:tetratricopeptide (TPR) repeat protein
MQSLWLPAIQAQLALSRRNPAAALSALQAASSNELGQITFVSNISCLYDVYIRGEAYLAGGQASAAGAEFQKILDHSGIVWNCWTGALAHLGVARANASQARTSQGASADAARVRALAAYKDFLTLWKDADSYIPILKEAKAEYAKLQCAPCGSSTRLTKRSIFRVLRCRGEFNENLRLLDPCLSDICTDPYKVFTSVQSARTNLALVLRPWPSCRGNCSP